jgi:hypothetical protein
MPHKEIIESVKNAVSAKGLPESASDRMLAWLNEAESGSFASSDQREQIHKILDAMVGYGSESDEEE